MEIRPVIDAVRKTMTRTAVMLLLALNAAGAWAADAPAAPAERKATLLAERHKAKEVACSDCHAEQPPAKAVGTAQCLSCHGKTHARLAAATHSEPNPHASHQGDQDCHVCHRAHKPSVDQCAQCHVTNWTVP